MLHQPKEGKKIYLQQCTYHSNIHCIFVLFFLFVCFFFFWWEGDSFFLLFFKYKLLKSLLLTTAIIFRAQIPLPFLWLHVYETSVIVISSSSDASHCQFYGLCTSGAADVRQELGQEVNHHYVILRQE